MGYLVGWLVGKLMAVVKVSVTQIRVGSGEALGVVEVYINY